MWNGKSLFGLVQRMHPYQGGWDSSTTTWGLQSPLQRLTLEELLPLDSQDRMISVLVSAPPMQALIHPAGMGTGNDLDLSTIYTFSWWVWISFQNGWNLLGILRAWWWASKGYKLCVLSFHAKLNSFIFTSDTAYSKIKIPVDYLELGRPWKVITLCTFCMERRVCIKVLFSRYKVLFLASESASLLKYTNQKVIPIFTLQPKKRNIVFICKMHGIGVN